MAVDYLLKGYNRTWLRFDVLAGLTAASIVIPKAMACAVIAGLPVHAGLYVSFVPMFVYALLGSSRLLSVSSTSTLAILTATQLAQVVPDGDPARMITAASALALLTGTFLVLAGVLRLGFVANFISDPVLTGFKAGAGLVVVFDQLPKLLGVHIVKSGFFRDIFTTLQQIPDTHLPTLVLAVAMLVLLYGMERFWPKIPSLVVVVALGIAIAGILGLQQYGVALTGPIQTGIPHPAVPDLALLGSLWPGALGIALMSFAESVAAGRAFARREDPRPSPNRELIALGAANLAGGFFQSFPAGGGTSQTAVNAGAGARTQVAGLVTVAVVAATLLFLAPLFSLLPLSVLGAIVVMTAIPMLRPADFRHIWQIRHTEFWWALAACVGVMILGTLQGILLAVAISVLTLLYQATHPPVYAVVRKQGTEIFRPMTGEHPEDEMLPGLLILRTEGRMNFASAPQVGERMWAMLAESRPQVVILECSAVPDIEYTALQNLTVAEEKLRKTGISLWLAALNPAALAMIKNSPLGRTLGDERIFPNVREAVKAYESKGERT